MEEIKIKYLADIPKLEKFSNGDWIDLRAAKNVYFQAHEFKMIPLGVAMELPEGYEAVVIPRSSTFKNYGLLMANSMGLIDESYKGDNDQWHFPAYATDDVLIKKGVRICQFRIIKHQPPVTFTEMESLGNEDRNGLGSTGIM